MRQVASGRCAYDFTSAGKSVATLRPPPCRDTSRTSRYGVMPQAVLRGAQRIATRAVDAAVYQATQSHRVRHARSAAPARDHAVRASEVSRARRQYVAASPATRYARFTRRA